MLEQLDAKYTERKAILYVRQSTAQQATSHEEGLRLQYEMENRIRELGFADVEVIDDDLGRTASGFAERPGFARMVAEVGLGKVGAVGALEVSRFARNSRDWSMLIEICSMVDTVLVDHDSIYHPRRSNDRLLLGLKGSLNEYELGLMRQRMNDAIKAKARRGELHTLLPVGYCKTEDGKLEKNPDRRVQKTIELLFGKVLELGSARQVVGWLGDHQLDVPVRPPGCVGHRWQLPTVANVCRVLTNPIYCGTYAYGRTHRVTQVRDGQLMRVTRRRADGECDVLLHDHHEGYVEREVFERVQKLLADNNAKFRKTKPGPARPGKALLGGLARCGRCGRPLHVTYGGERRIVRYVCSGAQQGCEESCITFVGTLLDETVSEQVLEVVRPGAQQAALEAARCGRRTQHAVLDALERDLEAARYAATLARRQYDATDPENRLVAAELESRWEAALVKVEGLQSRVATARADAEREAPTPVQLGELARDLERVWNAPDVDLRLKKRIVRVLVEEVVVDLNRAAESRDLHVVIHWKGGVHTEHRIRLRRPGETGTTTSEDTLDAIRTLARICTDRAIAIFLARNGRRTGRGKTWTTSRLRAIRNDHGIPVYDAERCADEGWLTLTQAAKRLGVTSKTVRRAIDRGLLDADHPLPFGPWIIRRDALDDPALRASLASPGTKRPAEGQQNFKISNDVGG